MSEQLAYIGVELGHGDIIIGSHTISEEGYVKGITFRHSAKVCMPGDDVKGEAEYASSVVQYVAFKDDEAIDRLIATLERLKTL